MPRANRVCFPGALYHIYQRGNNKQDIFRDDSDRGRLLRLFLDAKKEFGYYLYCYALMDNHFHATIETPNAIPISKIMHFISSNYATYFNGKHDRAGHLFQGRFGSIIVEKDSYLLELSRYVHLNPVKSNFVNRPEEYKWSSYNVYAENIKDVLVDSHLILNLFDGKNAENARKAYKEFVEEKVKEVKDEDDWLDKNVKRKHFLGSKNFIKNVQKRGQAPLFKNVL